MISNGNRTELSPIWSVITCDFKNWMTPEQESEMLITSESKSRTKYKK